MWNKLEKIYLKYIKIFGSDAIHLINLIICLKIANNFKALVSFEEFIKEIKTNKLTKILGIEINNSWGLYFNKINLELLNFKLKNEKDIKNISYLFEKLVNRKEKGTYYTPSDVVEYITKNTIRNSLCVNFKKNNFDKVISNISIDRTISELLDSGVSKSEIFTFIIKIKILDPACGSGTFLLTAFEIIFNILKRLKEKNVKKSDLALYSLNTLYGVDIERKAVAITKTLLLMKILMVDGNNGFCNFSWNNFKVGNSLFGDVMSIKKEDYLSKVNIKGKNRKPFLWRKEFGNIKFDCIIGNPPYIEFSKAIRNYPIDPNFVTKKCGNVYALILERSFDLLKKGGSLGMIIPISFISTNRMSPIFDKVRNTSEYFYISSFADRPSCLFSGVHQKLNILFSKEGVGGNLFTSSYIHWYKDDRKNIFNNIQYIKNTSKTKIGSEIEKNILKKIENHKKPLSFYFEKKPTTYSLYVNIRACFFIKTSLLPQKSKEFKEIFFKTQSIRNIINSIINSNLVFLLWEVFSDGWHLQPNFDFVKFDIEAVNPDELSRLELLSIKLNDNLEKNKVRVNTKQTEYEYKHKMAKNIMDEIDEIIGKSFKFTKKEINYLKQYNIKSRLSDYYNNYLDLQEK